MIRKYGSRRHEVLIPLLLRNHRVKEISFLCWIDRTTLLIVHALSPQYSLLRVLCFKRGDEHPCRTKAQPTGMIRTLPSLSSISSFINLSSNHGRQRHARTLKESRLPVAVCPAKSKLQRIKGELSANQYRVMNRTMKHSSIRRRLPHYSCVDRL